MRNLAKNILWSTTLIAVFFLTGARFAVARPVVDSAIITVRPFHELNVHGEPNGVGLVLIGVRKGPMPYKLEVSGATVTAHPLFGSGPSLLDAWYG